MCKVPLDRLEIVVLGSAKYHTALAECGNGCRGFDIKRRWGRSKQFLYHTLKRVSVRVLF